MLGREGETASIETSVVMVDTKATTKPKKQQTKKLLGTLLNTFDGGGNFTDVWLFYYNKRRFHPALEAGG
jgi:exopolysaccharide biosynthesis predicted pyruvyltransferase EpsI